MYLLCQNKWENTTEYSETNASMDFSDKKKSQTLSHLIFLLICQTHPNQLKFASYNVFSQINLKLGILAVNLEISLLLLVKVSKWCYPEVWCFSFIFFA